jgi:DNA-binding response OmpR family regulator
VNLDQPECALIATQPSASPALRMLVVDVNEGPRAAIQMLMSMAFPLVHVDFAPDPWSALRWLAKQEYDLVLTETRLPGLSGHGLVRRLRARHPRVWCSIMTALEPHLALKALSELRPVFAMMKPFSLEEFSGALRCVIRSRQDLAWIERIEVSSAVVGSASPANGRTSRGF